MLEKLGFKKRTHIGISISANNFIELVYLDKATKSVVKYASGNIKYNNAIKEIMDFEELTEVLSTLFEEAGLEPGECAVTLTIPNVHFDITSFDSESDKSLIRENLQADIEDLYIFKRNEPYIQYSIVEHPTTHSKMIVYSAIQVKVLNKLMEIFDTLGADIVRIESSYSSLLKSIQFVDKFHNFVQKEQTTSILLITASNCSTFFLNSGILVDYMDEPLAIKSFSPEEVYMTISKIAENAISKNKSDNFLIISETDDVNAELLSQRVKYEGTMEFLNKSVNSSDPFIDVSSGDTDIDPNIISYLTLEAVGAAAADYETYPLDLNFLPAERINANIVQVGPYEVDFYRFMGVVLLGALLIAALIGFIIVLILSQLINSNDEKKSGYQSEIKVFKETIERDQKSTQKDILPKLTEVLDNNKKLLEVYTALSTDIPESIYIKRFVVGMNGGVAILGEAKSSESVENFVKSLREKNPNLTLAKLSVNTKYDPVPAKIPNGFTFEIKTQGKEIPLIDNSFQVRGFPSSSTYNVAPGGSMPGNPMMPPPSPII